MEVPDGLGIFIHLTLYQLFADQYGLIIKGQFEYDGVTVKFDTSEPVLTRADVVKRYGKTKKEIERESK
jgi:hypothetical protein